MANYSKYFLPILFFSSSLFASDYTFIDKENPWHVEGRYRAVAKADFDTEGYKDSNLLHSDAYASLFYSQWINPNNTLSYEVGYSHLKFDWNKNPLFKQDKYNYLRASLALVTTSIDKWRWVLNLGTRLDIDDFNYSNAGLIYGVFWGRTQFTPSLGIHTGFLGYIGVKNKYVLPILGFDWAFASRWKLNLIFPIDLSLQYQIAKCFYSSLRYSTFGGLYRIPYRAHQGTSADDKDPIFKLYSQAAELDFKFVSRHFSIGAGGGWNFGGWIYIKNGDNHHGKYFRYDSALFGQINAGFTF